MPGSSPDAYDWRRPYGNWRQSLKHHLKEVKIFLLGTDPEPDMRPQGENPVWKSAKAQARKAKRRLSRTSE